MRGDFMSRTTSRYDKNGNEIFEGNRIEGKTMDGDTAIFIVRWSDYHGDFIGDCPDEIYDVSPSIFHQYEIID